MEYYPIGPIGISPFASSPSSPLIADPDRDGARDEERSNSSFASELENKIHRHSFTYTFIHSFRHFCLRGRGRGDTLPILLKRGGLLKMT